MIGLLGVVFACPVWLVAQPAGRFFVSLFYHLRLSITECLLRLADGLKGYPFRIAFQIRWYGM